MRYSVSARIRQPSGHFSQATMIEARGRLVFISGMTTLTLEHLTTPRNYAPHSTKGDDKMVSHHDATFGSDDPYPGVPVPPMMKKRRRGSRRDKVTAPCRPHAAKASSKIPPGRNKMTKRFNLNAVDRRTIVKAGAVAGLA